MLCCYRREVATRGIHRDMNSFARRTLLLKPAIHPYIIPAVLEHTAERAVSTGQRGIKRRLFGIDKGIVMKCWLSNAPDGNTIIR